MDVEGGMGGKIRLIPINERAAAASNASSSVM